MSQTFNLCIATEKIADNAQQLGVSIDTLRAIQVVVHATIMQQPQLHLQLTYQIILPTQSLVGQLDWPTWKEVNVGFTDYLWEESCLECFITGNSINNHDMADISSNSNYIEVNASPDGRYALYQFDSYRNPATLPPLPLLLANGPTPAKISWTDRANTQIPSINANASNKLSKTHTPHSCERTFGVPLDKLSSQNFAISNMTIEHINPCVILWFGETALYFAPIHASPPDFHDRRYWSRFDPETALLNQLTSSIAIER